MMYVTRLLPLAMNVTIDILAQCYATSSQARVRLPPTRIPHAGLVWCFSSAVFLFKRIDNGDAAHGQLFSLHLVL